MSLLTIISDWKYTDYYLGILKGDLKSKINDIEIIDIKHDVDSFNISQAAFITNFSYKHFPKGTIHLIAVKSEATPKHKHIIIKDKGHYFICADNGIPGLIFKENPELIVKLETVEIQTTFPELAIFTKAAKFISEGGDITELGETVEHIHRQLEFLPGINADYIAGTVIYNDSYGNAITNISKEVFEKYGKARDFEINFVSTRYVIKTISSNYSEVDNGEKLAVFNSIGLLELAQNNGNAKNLLGLEKGTDIKIKFK